MRAVLFAVMGIGAVMVLSYATIINVPGDYETIQAGINASTDGDTVLVQPDTYYECINFNGHNIVLGSLFLTTGNTSYVSSTIIDGDSLGSVVTFENGEDSTAIITGFTIRNGSAFYGGGIFCSMSSDPLIRHNIISGNFAQNGGGIYGTGSSLIIVDNTIIDNAAPLEFGCYGGAIYCVDHAHAMISNNIIQDNTAHQGAGIYCGANSNVSIVDNVVSGNRAWNHAGGIYVVNSNCYICGNLFTGNYGTCGSGIDCDMSLVDIIDNRFIENEGRYGAGFYAIRSNVSVTGNLFRGNFTGYLGGGGGAIYLQESHGTVSGNLIVENSSELYGGGIYCSEADPVISDNIIFNNEAESYGGGIICSDGSNSIITGNVIVENSAENGGGICCYDESNPVIINNAILRNSAEDYGGGISCVSDAFPEIKNVIVWDNDAPDGAEIYDDAISQASVSYCDVKGGWIGVGNIDVDPLILYEYQGEQNVCQQSPCIDAGDPNLFDPDGSRSDIGVYYPQHPECFQGNVWHVSITGNDSTGNGSPESPFRTISHGIGISAYGDTVIVGNGTYQDNVFIIYKHIVLASPFIYSGDVEDIQDTVIEGDSGASVITIEGQDSLAVVAGLTLRNGQGNYGGGVTCIESNLDIKNNIITANASNGYNGGGGGVYCSQSSISICNSTISGNTTYGNYNIEGGGLCCINSNAVVRNSLIVENSGFLGGGIYLNNSDLSLSNVTLSRNIAEVHGGGIYCSNSDIIGVNSIIWGDSSAYNSEIYLYGSSSSFTYCDIFGGWSGTGNLNYGPMFRDPQNGDYYLATVECGGMIDSPCIDTGDPATQDSILDCWHGLRSTLCDMGAYGGNNLGWSLSAKGNHDNRTLTLKSFALYQNYPNPFNPVTTIVFDVPVSCITRVSLFNLLGQHVATLMEGSVGAGEHRIVWNADGMPSGIYFCKMNAGEYSQVRKLLLLK